MMKRFLWIMVLRLLLVGCVYHQHAEYYKAINTSNKSIGMPASNKYVAYDLQKIFRENGWKILIVDTGGVKTTGQTGSETSLTTKEQSNASYFVYLNQNRWDTCFPTFGDALIRYDISIVEAKTGEQVFFQEGNDCRSKIQKQLKSALSPFFK